MKSTVNVKCGHSGCSKYGHYGADNNKDRTRIHKKYGNGKYRCCRHTSPDKVLGVNNLKRQVTFVADKSKKYPKLPELFWDDGNGFTHGPGFMAYANDFPEGTKLIITAEIVLPEGAE